MTRLLTTILLLFAASRIRPGLRLRAHRARVAATPERLARELRDRLVSGGDVVVAEEEAMVSRFSGTAGRFRWNTVELVRFRPERIEFEHLGGTFRGTIERFALAPVEGGTEVSHTGTLRMPGGLLGWAVGLVFARRAFEEHVAEHMDVMVERHRTSSGADSSKS